MYNAFWRHALFVRSQLFSVKILHRSHSSFQVIRLGTGDDFRGPSGQALPLPSRVFLSRARSSRAHYSQASATQVTVDHFSWENNVKEMDPALQNIAGNHHTSWRTKQLQGLQVFIQINAFRKKKNLKKTRTVINIESFSRNKKLNA